MDDVSASAAWMAWSISSSGSCASSVATEGFLISATPTMMGVGIGFFFLGVCFSHWLVSVRKERKGTKMFCSVCLSALGFSSWGRNDGIVVEVEILFYNLGTRLRDL